MSKRNENNETLNNKRDVNTKDIVFYIANKKYLLPFRNNINKNKFMQIGDFYKELISKKIFNIDLKLLRKWDEKEILPAYRFAKGAVRVDTRYYIKEHVLIVKEILRLKEIGLNISDIEKVIFFNYNINMILLNKNIKNKESFNKMKNTINNIDNMEAKLIIPSIKSVDKKVVKNILNDNSLYTDVLKKEDISLITFISILNKACINYKNKKFDKLNFKYDMINTIENINKNLYKG